MKTTLTLILAALVVTTGFTYARPRGGAPAGGDRPVPPAVLAEFDTDGDGVLSDAEKAAMKAAMESKKEEFIAKHDADGDGVLNSEERAAAKAAMEAAHAAKITTKFEELDTDSSGGLSAAEFAAGAPEGADANKVAVHYAKLDVNSDGSVTAEEFAARPKKGGKPKRK